MYLKGNMSNIFKHSERIFVFFSYFRGQFLATDYEQACKRRTNVNFLFTI